MKPIEFAEGVKVAHDYGAIPAQDARAVDHAITSRRSIRAFLPTPVPRETIMEILDVASRSPSGSNIQPWKVTVVTGASRDALCKLALAAHDAAPRNGKYQREFEYYPREWTSPYIERRRTLEATTIAPSWTSSARPNRTS